MCDSFAEVVAFFSGFSNFEITLPISGSNGIGTANFVEYINGGTGSVIDNFISIKAIATDPLSGTNEPFVAIFQYDAS